METDIELIARVIASDDHKAFGRLVQRHQSSVRRLWLRLTRGNGDLSNDLAQDTFIKAYRKLSSFRGSGSFPGWLFRIAYNNFLEFCRKEARAKKLLEAEQSIAYDHTVETGIDARLDIEKALALLNLNERTAITLCYTYGMSHSEVARTMDIPIGTVKSHVTRGKEKLAKRLKAWKGKTIA